MHKWQGENAFPNVITVFSAPNYCGEYGNKGAVIVLENENLNVKQYGHVQAPFHLPEEIDLFEWSIPFLLEKVTDCMIGIGVEVDAPDNGPVRKTICNFECNQVIEQFQSGMTPEEEKAQKKRRVMQKLKAKVMTMARMNIMLRKLREN